MGKVLNLIIDMEGLELPPPDKEKTPQELVAIVLHNIMYSYARNGLKKDERKQYYKVVDVIDKAVKGKQDSVELEDTSIGFIRKCQREASMAPNRLLQRVEDLIDSIKDR